MSKVLRGGYVFVTWKGDHSPRHVHVYREGKLVLKWDLENQKPMAGQPSRKVLEFIHQLDAEGLYYEAQVSSCQQQEAGIRSQYFAPNVSIPLRQIRSTPDAL
ncbi:MAG: hypothetical protein FJY85_18690 [Deltaproteobacteria bacterium]|nr:hypothetical protein [Deltaproteobacteria bacterium]